MDKKMSQVLPDPLESPSETETESLPINKHKDSIKTNKDNIKTSKDSIKTSKDNIKTNKDNIKTSKKQLVLSSVLNGSKARWQSSAQQFKQKSKRTRTMIIASVVALLALLGIGVYTLWYQFLATQQVTVFQVGRQQMVTENIGGGGLVAAKQDFNVQFPLAERVLNVMVKPGDQVKRNQGLIKLDPSQLNVQVQQASNDVAAAQAYLNSVSVSAPNPVTIAQAQQAYEIANNHYHALLAQTNNATLHNGNLVSPVNGVVTTVLISPGEVFGANTILMTLMDQSSVIVHTQIPLANLQQVRLGANAQVSPSALPDITLDGTVTGIIPQANAQTDTFQIDVTVTNTKQILLPGMSAFVRVQGQQNAFAVPRISVLNPDHESTVFLIHNGHAYMKQVHVAGSAPDYFYVDSGLSANDQIVVIPLNRLHHGQSVTINTVDH